MKNTSSFHYKLKHLITQPMNNIVICFIVILFCFSPENLAMDDYDSPRLIRSYVDRELASHLDILQVRAKIEDNSLLQFKVNFRPKQFDEPSLYNQNQYLVLELTQASTHYLVIQIGEESANLYQLTPSNNQYLALTPGTTAKRATSNQQWQVQRNENEILISLPTRFFNFQHALIYDSYSVHGQASDKVFTVNEVYDRAAKGRLNPKKVSVMKLYNQMCQGTI